MLEDIATSPASELIRLYRRKELSPVEVTQAVLLRIEELEAVLNTFVIRDDDGALLAARESEARWSKGEPKGLIDGVPVSIKDMLICKGMPTRRGSVVLPPDPGSEDSPAAARVRAAGGVILGKTTTCEFGWKGVTDSPVSGITRNPWNPDLTPGGSSGGAAAGVAVGMASLAVGTDGGGSVRIPSAFTGVFGIKPTQGIVCVYPPSPIGTLSHVGPLTRTVTDGALLLSVLAGLDPRDVYAAPVPSRDYRIGLDDGVAGLRIAYAPDFGYGTLDAEVAEIVGRAVASLVDLGAQVEAIEPGFADPREAMRTLFLAPVGHLAHTLAPEQRARLDPGFDAAVEVGAGVTTSQYLQAVSERERLGLAMARLHETHDLLITPTLPIPAFAVGQDAPSATSLIPSWLSWNPYCFVCNLTGQPAASVPCGFTGDGLPVGLHILGPRFADALVLRAARAYEATQPIALPRVESLLERARTA